MKALPFLALFVSASVTATIYPPDNRVEAILEGPSNVQELAGSIPALVRKSNIKSNNDGTWSAVYKPLTEAGRLCEDEVFSSQPMFANCSAFLIGPNLVATAGHCFNETHDNWEMRCEDYKIIFDYVVTEEGLTQKFQESQVYDCKKLVARKLQGNLDYAIIELDRPVIGRKPVKLAQNPATMGTPLFILGFPYGVPMKYTDDGFVTSVSADGTNFRQNLDTFSVNSGSATFDAFTLEVVGIHVRGRGGNFSRDVENNCQRWNVATGGEYDESNAIHLLFPHL